MDSYIKLMEYSLVLVTAKRYTRKQIERKLMQYVKINLSEESNIKEVIERVLERLEELAYVDDAQYCKDFIADRIRFKPRGKMLLKQELIKKGVGLVFIEEALERCGADEVEMGEVLLAKRSEGWRNDPIMKQRDRAARFLNSKGFSRETIYTLIEKCYS